VVRVRRLERGVEGEGGLEKMRLINQRKEDNVGDNQMRCQT
jgi:hypothetical protein